MSDTSNNRREALPHDDEWITFICYRRVDGADAAQWLYNALHGLRLPLSVTDHQTAPKLHIYFDQAAPAVDDWTKMHEPALKRARSFLFVCSPGAHAKLDADDWVYRELEWWLTNRSTAPIVIDPTGEGERWIPRSISERWPNAQRLVVMPRQWATLAHEDQAKAEREITERLVGGIVESERRTTYEDLERERALTRRLRAHRRYLLVSVAIATCLTIAAIALGLYAQRQRLTSKSRAFAAMAMQALQDNPVQALRLSLAAVKAVYTPESEHALSMALTAARVRQIFVFDADSGFSRVVERMAFSSDGTQLLAASADGTARVWSARTGQQVLRLDHNLPVYYAAYSPDGRYIVTAGHSGLVRKWDSKTGHLVGSFIGHDRHVTMVEFSRSGRYVATSDSSGRTILWKFDSLSRVAFLKSSRKPHNLAFSPDETLVATYSVGIRLWSSNSGRLVASVDDGNEIRGFGFASGRSTFVSVLADGRIHRHNLRDLARVEEWPGLGVVRSASISPDGSRVLTFGLDGTARLSSIAPTYASRALEYSGDFWSEGLFAPDAKQIVTLGSGSTVRAWDADDGALLHVLSAHRDRVSTAAFSPDGALLATGDESGAIFLWDIGERRGAPFLLTAIEGVAIRARFVNNDHSVLVTGVDRRLSVFDRISGSRHDSLDPVYAGLYDAWISPAGDRLVTVGRYSDHALLRVFALNESCRLSAARLTKEFALRDVADERILERRGAVAVSVDGTRIAAALTLAAPALWVLYADDERRTHWELTTEATAVALSPDGRLLVASGLSNAAEIWDVDAQSLVRKLVGHASAVVQASFSSSGQRIVTASLDGTARIWDVRSGRTLVVLRGHSGELNYAEFSPNGQRVVTAGSDGTVRTWDADSGMELQRLDAVGPVRTASYSGDGRLVVTAGSGVRVFTVDTHEMVRVAEERLPPEDPRLPTDSRVPTGIR